MLTICIILIVLLALDLLFTLALRCRKGHKKWELLKKYRYAHRGFHDKPQIPENSLPAFRRAIEHGFGAELDVHLLKDGTLAVFHDSDLRRCTGTDGQIEDLTLEELKQLRLEGTDEQIPTFDEVLALFETATPLIIELKTAPEAGTQRLRDAINKNVTEEEILTTCATAFSGGWNSVKLYFMLGLPTETDEDVIGIAELVYKILQVWRENGNGKKRGLSINLATAYFVPKPFTPFQWQAQITPEEYLRRVHLLQANLHAKCVDYRYHESDLSRLEAVMARGDRRVGKALLEAHRLGCRLDGWDEYFDYEKWIEAFRRTGLDPDYYTTRGFGADEILPWQTIDVGVTEKFLAHERDKALRSEATPDCRTHCNGCGARRLSERGLCDESPAV